MSTSDIFIALLLTAVAAYAARNVYRALTTGRATIPGGRTHERARSPRNFWMAAGFEALMFVILAAMLVRTVTAN